MILKRPPYSTNLKSVPRSSNSVGEKDVNKNQTRHH